MEHPQVDGRIPVLPGHGEVRPLPPKHVHGRPEEEEGGVTLLCSQTLYDSVQSLSGAKQQAKLHSMAQNHTESNSRLAVMG